MRAPRDSARHARQNGGLALRYHDLRKSAVRVAAIKDQDPAVTISRNAAANAKNAVNMRDS